MSRPLRIGQFAARTGLSIRTLRFYDALGLLVPAEVDPETRYRLYTPAQTAKARVIAELRRLGFSLEEIGQALRRETPQEMLLQEAAARLERNIAVQSAQLVDVRARLGALRGLEVLVRREPARWIASVRDRVDCASDTAELFLELQAGLVGAQLDSRGVLWHRCGHEDGPLTAEPYVLIPQRVRGRGRVEIGELPAVEVAVVRTRDEDEAAEEGYATLKNWLAEQGHVLRGAKREVPLEGSGELEVQFPFRLLT